MLLNPFVFARTHLTDVRTSCETLPWKSCLHGYLSHAIGFTGFGAAINLPNPGVWQRMNFVRRTNRRKPIVRSWLDVHGDWIMLVGPVVISRCVPGSGWAHCLIQNTYHRCTLNQFFFIMDLIMFLYRTIFRGIMLAKHYLLFIERPYE